MDIVLDRRASILSPPNACLSILNGLFNGTNNSKFNDTNNNKRRLTYD